MKELKRERRQRQSKSYQLRHLRDAVNPISVVVCAGVLLASNGLYA